MPLSSKASSTPQGFDNLLSQLVILRSIINNNLIVTDKHVAEISEELQSIQARHGEKELKDIQLASTMQSKAEADEREIHQLQAALDRLEQEKATLCRKMKEVRDKNSFFEQRNQELYRVVHALERKMKQMESSRETVKVKQEGGK